MNHRLTLAAAAATTLASVSLYALFAGPAWFWAGVGAIVVAAGTGTLTRLRTLPAGACLAAGAAGLLVYLNVVFAAARSWLFVVPDPGSLSYLWRLANQGVTEANRFAPPVPATPGLLLLAAAGIGAVAVVTDLLAVRLRWAGLAGLPLLVLFSVPTGTSATRGAAGTAIVFVLGAAGYLAMLGADSRERIRVWGRLVTLWRTGFPGTRALAATGRRVGLVTVAAALCIPLIVPGLHAGRLFAVHGKPGALGGSALFPSPLAGMNADLHESQPQTVLMYHTTDPEPDYLQMYVLSDLTTTSWTMGQRVNAAAAGGKLPPAPGLARAGGYRVTTSVSVDMAAGRPAGGLTFLPLPYPSARISVAGRWYTDPGTLTVFSPEPPRGVLDYTVTSSDLQPTVRQLSNAPPPPAAITRQYLSVPWQFRSLTSLARKVTAGTTSAYGKALALQQWFTQSGGFSYSLDTPEPDSAAALGRFLTVTKSGYCQQFAFAMAVLARLLGIPSRVAVGFTAGTPEGNGTWDVKSSDAHAWPELYFQGAGWLRFEPTPAGADGQETASPPGYAIPRSGPSTPGNGLPPVTGIQGNTAPPANSGGSTERNPQARPAPGTQAGTRRAVRKGAAPVIPVAAGLLALAVVLLLIPRTCRSLIRRRRWALAVAAGRTTAGDGPLAHAAWRELADDLADYRAGRRPSESPRAAARRVAEELALPCPAREALGRIALAEELATYSRRPGPPGTLRADVADVRRGIAASAGRRARWRAWFFPASVLVPVRAGTRRLLGVTSRPDVAWRAATTRVRRWVRTVLGGRSRAR